MLYTSLPIGTFILILYALYPLQILFARNLYIDYVLVCVSTNKIDVHLQFSNFFFIIFIYSICVTVVVLNVHFRSPQTHRMAPWVKTVFIQFLPKLLFIKRPAYNFETR